MDDSKIKSNSSSLNGVKVVDLTRALAGPVCTMILADMGAEVIKIEEPQIDNSGLKGQKTPAGKPNPFYRNKKSITLNLRTDKGKKILHRLIQWGDVIVENYRPGVMNQMGFDYQVVREINPRMVMTSISGYGQTGPYANRAAFDTVGQAMGGLMRVTGHPPPTDAGAAVSDITSGVFGALGTVIALYHQKATGSGQHVESTLVESIVFLMGLNFSSYFNGDIAETDGLLSPSRTPGADCFQTKDGLYVIIMAQMDNHWAILARIIGREDLTNAPGYTTRAERGKHGEEIKSLIQAWVGMHTRDEVEAIVDKAGLPFGRVQTLTDLLADPQLNARKRFINTDYNGKVIPVFAPYPILSETPGSIRIPWQKPGEHNKEIYEGILAFSPEELTDLKREGVI